MAKPKKTKTGDTAWDKIQNRPHNETVANRDVYEDQQLERKQLEDIQKPTSRLIAAAIIGIAVFLLTWTFISLLAVGAESVKGLSNNFSTPQTVEDIDRRFENQEPTNDPYEFYVRELTDAGYCYGMADEEGHLIPNQPCYTDSSEVPFPQWYVDKYNIDINDPDTYPENQSSFTVRSDTVSFSDYFFAFNFWKFVISLAAGLGVYSAVRIRFLKNLEAQNLMRRTDDINQNFNDQHITLPMELPERFATFPDAGARCSVEVNSMVSHMMLKDKGVKKIDLARRADKDTYDDDGNLLYYKGEILYDNNGNPVTDKVPIIDTQFGNDLFKTSGIPEDKTLRKFYDAKTLPHNPNGRNREFWGSQDTVLELINDDWDFPLYEPQRPAGVYLVDSAPVNTMVLAITRAGKGQTYIEPVIDMWLREKRSHNMVINDPKGELLVKHYVRATYRGYQVIQFNLINPMKTDIYNPLGMAAEAAREGDFKKCALYVENIADVFFPLDGGDDPVWPNAANNAFKRASYGLIDFFLEEERELRAEALRTHMEPEVLEKQLDDMWGKVTLYNCYQLFVNMTAKKLPSPKVTFDKRLDAGEFADDEALGKREYDKALRESEIWGNEQELDMLTLYFNATEFLPENGMRTLIANANNALKSMAGAEKMLASVYGIAITAMSFFTDPTIATLTSGTPSQNTDLAGLSFPRRMGVRFHADYLKTRHLVGLQVKWQAYSDKNFTESMGSKFFHEDIVTREGWARYYFDGIFPGQQAYIKMELVNASTGMLIEEFYFEFTKSFATNFKGTQYMTDPVLGEKIIKNGILRELVPERRGSTNRVEGRYTFKKLGLAAMDSFDAEIKQVEVDEPVFITNNVRYSEKPKAVFLVTPPHLMKYAKLILILVKQLVDLNFDLSYMTKESQKPPFKTRFMLDELGNLQSEGHGISGFETMLSIGLGQEQQFTLILQTLQQLRAVYGDDVDKVVQGNTSNIVFLKSTDDSMLDTLTKMSGTTHVGVIESKTVTQDVGKLKFVGTDEKASYTMSSREKLVIEYNDLAFISPRQSIVFRAGDSPVWNRNETILPMSWRLYKNTVVHPGHKYTLQTIPTLSTALEFDFQQNQPDFGAMLAKRIAQASRSVEAKEKYREAYGYSDFDIQRLEKDVYADEVMTLIAQMTNLEIADQKAKDEFVRVNGQDASAGIDGAGIGVAGMGGGAWSATGEKMNKEARPNEAVQKAAVDSAADIAAQSEKIFADGYISRDDLVTFIPQEPDDDGHIRYRTKGKEQNSIYQSEFSTMFERHRASFERDFENFNINSRGDLLSYDGSEVYLRLRDESEYKKDLVDAAENEGTNVYGDDEADSANYSYDVMPAFYKFLGDQDSWEHIAEGVIESGMARIIREEQEGM